MDGRLPKGQESPFGDFPSDYTRPGDEQKRCGGTEKDHWISWSCQKMGEQMINIYGYFKGRSMINHKHFAIITQFSDKSTWVSEGRRRFRCLASVGKRSGRLWKEVLSQVFCQIVEVVQNKGPHVRSQSCKTTFSTKRSETSSLR